MPKLDVPLRPAPAVVTSTTDLIGGTPMLELTRFQPRERAAIFAKLELANPGGSIKDRTALGLILWAEQQGLIRPGDTLVEPTAGNTGIGLALVGIQRGYRVVLVVPERFSEEKTLLMEALGGEVVKVSTEAGMKGAIERAHEIAAATPGAFVPQQFASQGNPLIHYYTTAPEIWQQLDGRIDAVVIGVGTGGTFTGVARFLKETRPDILCVAVEPNGSILGGGEAGEHEVEGIGNSFIPEILDVSLFDEVMMVHDDDCFATAKEIAATEGVLIGGSAGANGAAALRVARRLGPGHRVVTLFPDSAERYLSKGRLGGPRATVHRRQPS